MQRVVERLPLTLAHIKLFPKYAGMFDHLTVHALEGLRMWKEKEGFLPPKS